MKTSFTLFTILLLITATRAIGCTVPPTSSEAAITASGPTTFCNYFAGGNDYEFGSVNLTVATSGLIYQWKNNDLIISGATNQTYTVGITGSFTCDVSNDCGTTTSNSISTTSLGIPHPVITASGSTLLCSGDSVILSTSGTFDSYYWVKNFSGIAGATTSSYVAKEPGLYILYVSNICHVGNSNAFTISAGILNSTLVSISASGSTTICNGNSVVLTVATAGLTYQWTNNGTIISGATEQSFSASAGGNYACNVSNSCSNLTSNTIAVSIITSPPTSAQATITVGGTTTVCTPGNVVLSVTTAGLTYQWKNNGSNISGATQQSYTATVTGNYTCDVSNNCGTTGSNSIAVTVNTAPTSGQATISAGGTTTFCSGGSVVLSVATSGFTYNWKNNGISISGATNQSFTATATGPYTCEVSNSCGTVTSNSISVASSAPTTAQAAISASGPTAFCQGGSVVLTVATPGLNYQWKKNTSNIGGATQQNYTATKTATYKCVVSNSCGSVTSNSISVTQNLITATISQSPCSGGAVLLTCNSSPSTGVTFQWLRGRNILSGATNSTYSATVSALYKCTVTITAAGCIRTSKNSNVNITCRTSDESISEGIIVYPNPSADFFNINTSSLGQPCIIYIYDLAGRLVESHKVNGEEMKVGESLANGVYLLKIAENNKTIQVIKLVKNF